MRQVVLACALVVALSSTGAGQVAVSPGPADVLTFAGTGHTVYGDWRASGTMNTDRWRAGQALTIQADIRFNDGHVTGLAAAGIKADKLCLLVTARRARGLRPRCVRRGVDRAGTGRPRRRAHGLRGGG